MNLVVNFDQNQSSLPSGFAAAFNYVVAYFDSLFTSNATVTINVGFGEINGQALQSGELGESEQASVSAASYGTVRNALIAAGAPGAATLPAASPAPSSDTLYVPSAEEKALDRRCADRRHERHADQSRRHRRRYAERLGGRGGQGGARLYVPQGLDFNSDGHSDLAWQNANNGDVQIWRSRPAAGPEP